MNIAICDDNVYMTTKLEEIISSCFNDDNNAYTCDVFLSGEELLAELEVRSRKYQIYILDVEMAEINGLQTAAQIRKDDTTAVIIFVTSHEELMPEAFEVMAFHFLVKPIDEEKARQVFLRAVAAMEEKRMLFQFVVRKKVHTLCLEQIEYFESYGRKMVVHTIAGEEYEYYGTLKDVLERVPAWRFVQVHNSYVVNMEHIQLAEGEQIILDSGMEISVTRKHHGDFHAAYRNFVLMQGAADL